MFVSVTRLRIRRWWFLPDFAVHAIRSQRQVRRAPGFARGALLPDGRRTFWTMTLWTDAAAMRAYMTSGDHRTAMPKLLDWCDEASVVHWTTEDATLPGWAEAEARMRREGRASKVRHPSPVHAALDFAPARTTASATIEPERTLT